MLSISVSNSVSLFLNLFNFCWKCVASVKYVNTCCYISLNKQIWPCFCDQLFHVKGALGAVLCYGWVDIVLSVVVAWYFVQQAVLIAIWWIIFTENKMGIILKNTKVSLAIDFGYKTPASAARLVQLTSWYVLFCLMGWCI